MNETLRKILLKLFISINQMLKENEQQIEKTVIRCLRT